MSVSGHSLLRTIEADLRALSDVKDARRYPDVKEAAERALLKLRSVVKALPAEATLAQQAAAVQQADEDNSVMLVPFMLALASKSDALPLSALGAVQGATEAQIDIFFGWHEKILLKAMQVHYEGLSTRARMTLAKITGWI